MVPHSLIASNQLERLSKKIITGANIKFLNVLLFPIYNRAIMEGSKIEKSCDNQNLFLQNSKKA